MVIFRTGAGVCEVAAPIARRKELARGALLALKHNDAPPALRCGQRRRHAGRPAAYDHYCFHAVSSFHEKI